ncbi:MAG: hypothetical protein JWQ50_9426 [Caballeronia mineralivorans]|jgi:hypothetical protein|nr:hypothetical protein [Caballeronia mineralivorans]MEA3101946.1 hypothetical protein [Caballeronia mineralivorans]
MHFEYRGFNIECSATDGGAGFIGLATIYQASADGEDRKVFTSDSPRAFPTQLQAVDDARVWAEMWCDRQLTPEWAAHHATVQRRPAKKRTTTSRKLIGH